jgi:hypothetical protein
LLLLQELFYEGSASNAELILSLILAATLVYIPITIAIVGKRLWFKYRSAAAQQCTVTAHHVEGMSVRQFASSRFMACVVTTMLPTQLLVKQQQQQRQPSIRHSRVCAFSFPSRRNLKFLQLCLIACAAVSLMTARACVSGTLDSLAVLHSAMWFANAATCNDVTYAMCNQQHGQLPMATTDIAILLLRAACVLLYVASRFTNKRVTIINSSPLFAKTVRVALQ